MKFRPIDIWPRAETKNRRRSPFGASYTKTVTLLKRELDKIGARSVILMLAVDESEITLDGSRPKATARPRHPGVIVSAETRHGPIKIFADAFDDWKDNLRAIALGLHDLRRLDRYGIAKRGEQYSGWKALPGPDRSLPENGFADAHEAAEFLAKFSDFLDPEEILVDASVFDRAYRTAVKATHPDTAASSESAAEFSRVQSARSLIASCFL